VWQTGPTRLDDEHTPERLRDSIQGMRLDNPDVGFEYLDDNEQRAWVVDHFPSDVVDLYDGLPNNVMRADLWRYMVIAKEGGIYLDADVYLMSPFREWQALHPTMGGDDGWGRCDVIIGMENDTHLCQWALVSIRPEHPLMVHAMNFIIERVADHTKKSLQWKDLSKTRDPDNFVHVTTGPGVWTEAVADYFGLECCVEALSLVNILERNGGKIISANGVEGFVVGASQSIEPPAKDGNVCVFRSDFFGGGLLGNGYMSQWSQEELTEKQEAGEDTSGSWGSWTREADIFKFFSDLRGVLRYLDTDGDGKLTLTELSPLLIDRSLDSEIYPDLLPYFQHKIASIGVRSGKNVQDIFRESVIAQQNGAAELFSDPHLLQKYDQDRDGALSFEEIDRAVDKVVPGNRVEADEPLGPFKSPQLTGGLWEIDTGDYSGLAGLAVAAHDIIDDFDDDFADSFEYAGSSIAWLFVAAGALILLAGGIWVWVAFVFMHT